MTKNRARGTKLRHKLVRLSFGIIVISLISITAVFTFSSSNQAKTNLTKDIRVLAQVIGDRSIAALIFQDKRAAEKNLLTTNLNENVLKACLYDATGKLFASFSVDKLKYSCSAENSELDELVIEKSDRLSIYSRVIDSGETIGFINMHASTDEIASTMRNALVTAVVAFLAIVFMAFLVLNRLIKRVLSPLIDLHDTAVTIAQNPYSQERAEKLADDEVGKLVDVFNTMLDRLGSENEALVSSENRFRSLAANSPVGIYQMDKDHRLTYTNDKWRELTGLSEGTPLAQYMTYIDREESGFYEALLENVSESRRPKVIEYRFYAPGKDKSSIFMEHIAPILSDETKGGDVCGYVGSLLDISDLKNAQMELESLAFYDPLTNLPNRRFFRDHLQYLLAAAQHESSSIAILMLDLDNFKKVNDTLGHDAGDELLTVLSNRLRGLVAQRDVVSRMGGDEFMILLTDFGMRASIQRIADRILRAVQQPISIRGTEIDVTVSIGVATYPEDASSAEELIRNADLAPYLSKESGRNRLSFFSRELETVVNERVNMERKIREAIRNEAFTFYVQPQWSLNSGRLLSCEVLIRWFDEIEGPISPAEFIKVAEEAGLILEIGDWLIDKVISCIAEKKKQLEMLRIQYLAINLSARQFFSAKLAQTVNEKLVEYGVSPDMLEFELTESAVMEDTEMAIKVMERIKALGCRISIDDFGTGYSSLSYLKQFPIDSVKIDRSFISDIPSDQNDMEISSAIIAMGHSLGLQVVAEGVETQAQMDFLVQRGCDYAQGYFVTPPMPFEELFIKVPIINRTMEDSNGYGKEVS